MIMIIFFLSTTFFSFNSLSKYIINNLEKNVTVSTSVLISVIKKLQFIDFSYKKIKYYLCFFFELILTFILKNLYPYTVSN